MKRNIIKPRTLAIASLLLGVVLLSGCADNSKIQIQECLNGYTYGFWGGLWHGIIAPFDFLGMIFSDNIVVFAQNNNGAWYSLGFMLGSGGWGMLSSRYDK